MLIWTAQNVEEFGAQLAKVLAQCSSCEARKGESVEVISTHCKSFTIFTISKYNKSKGIHPKKRICFWFVPQQNSIHLSLCLYLSWLHFIFSLQSFSHSPELFKNIQILGVVVRKVCRFILKGQQSKKGLSFPTLSQHGTKLFKETRKTNSSMSYSRLVQFQGHHVPKSHKNTKIFTHAVILLGFY